MKTIRIVVVDDHILFRRGLASLLSEMPGMLVVGEASDGLEAVKVVADNLPDVVLLDVNMPGMNGVDTLLAFKKANIDTRVLMLTISEKDEDLLGSIVAGASGYLLKNTEPDILCQTIEQVAAGNSVISPEVTGQVLQAFRRARGESAHNLLSDREVEVLRCLARGRTTSQTADELFISENTVKTHIRHILEKLDVSNRAEAVAKAAQMGIFA